MSAVLRFSLASTLFVAAPVLATASDTSAPRAETQVGATPKLDININIKVAVETRTMPTGPGYVVRNGPDGRYYQPTLANGEVRTYLPGRWKTVPRDRAMFPKVYRCDGQALVIRQMDDSTFTAWVEGTDKIHVLKPTNVKTPGGQRLRVDLSPLFEEPGPHLMTINAVNHYLVVQAPETTRMRALARCEA